MMTLVPLLSLSKRYLQLNRLTGSGDYFAAFLFGIINLKRIDTYAHVNLEVYLMDQEVFLLPVVFVE